MDKGLFWRLDNIAFVLFLALLMIYGVSRGESPLLEWEEKLRKSTFIRFGLQRLYNPYYQYEVIGLGGTVLRPGPDGFTLMRAPAIPTEAEEWLDYRPYLIYQYWWSEDKGGRRITPFDLEGVYGDIRIEAHEIKYFHHKLDIRTGCLTIDMGLEGNAGNFRTMREEFVTPEGVLVIRIKDSNGVRYPFRLRIVNNPNISSYYEKYYALPSSSPFSFQATRQNNVLIVSAEREETCKAVIAVAIDTHLPFINTKDQQIGTQEPGEEVIYYIALSSSYEVDEPEKIAIEKAIKAQQEGFANLLKTTREWWKRFYERSIILLPDWALMKWYLRSLYYHGVFFGNASIPPGMWGTNPAGYAGGAIILEYDLVFSALALIYSNHFEEARRIVDWLWKILPRARENARYTKLHESVSTHTRGAKYGWSSDWDGHITIPLASFEGTNNYSNFPSLNAACIALNYVDFTQDISYAPIAKQILKETTEMAVEDLVWHNEWKVYINKNAPHALNHYAAIYGLTESNKRGIASADWADIAVKVLIPKGKWEGEDVLTLGYPSPELSKGDGDAPWLISLWWYCFANPQDPLIENTYKMLKFSKTGNYIFNRGWVAVFASKLKKGEEAYKWTKSLLEPDDAIYDDTSIVEAKFDKCDFARGPEIAAHGALICALTQMLIDVDSSDNIVLFPGIPENWYEESLFFEQLPIKGGLHISGRLKGGSLEVSISNSTDKCVERQICIKFPGEMYKLRDFSSNIQNIKIDGNFIIIPSLKILPQSKVIVQILFERK
ncbi:hypothetical protein H5T87_10705 [bacterium]|nr:hypothetical protein [bacterium]